VQQVVMATLQEGPCGISVGSQMTVYLASHVVTEC
jgi:hypothetical protein